MLGRRPQEHDPAAQRFRHVARTRLDLDGIRRIVKQRRDPEAAERREPGVDPRIDRGRQRLCRAAQPRLLGGANAAHRVDDREDGEGAQRQQRQQGEGQAAAPPPGQRSGGQGLGACRGGQGHLMGRDARTANGMPRAEDSRPCAAPIGSAQAGMHP
ncbi:hypothetical protein [Roseomonas sp. HF4]|uniref:hypothetical protein n=1 Tax=Roseomonas sp. HF4 TaxID=2562313 RepID=UPI0010C0020D|nr:hypothetical protein [Roseomonas sp. HF4]